MISEQISRDNLRLGFTAQRGCGELGTDSICYPLALEKLGKEESITSVSLAFGPINIVHVHSEEGVSGESLLARIEGFVTFFLSLTCGRDGVVIPGEENPVPTSKVTEHLVRNLFAEGLQVHANFIPLAYELRTQP